jgi:hypothetical protein
MGLKALIGPPCHGAEGLNFFWGKGIIQLLILPEVMQ